jgi:Na+/H+ antiporter NhaD/arsenite permease-like protein
VGEPTTFWLTVTIFTLTYAGLALGKVPGLRMDRAGIALVGATLMLVAGLLSFEQAVSTEAIDYKTLAVLFGMMVVLAFLRLSGFFQGLTARALRRIRSPQGLLAVTILLAGVLSAFLINDIVCLTLTPLVLHLARRLRFDPVPHLIALATAANIGSTGTITGNPQNIYIGAHAGIPYLRFALRLLPVAGFGLLVNYLVIAVVYRRRLATVPNGAENPPDENNSTAGKVGAGADSRPHRWLRRKSVAVTLIAVALFFTGLPLELIALGAAAALLVCRVRPSKVYRQIDWGLLVMFAGLFIVVHAFQLHVVKHWGIENWTWLLSSPVELLSLVSAGLSNLVSNVPAVLLLAPVVHAMPGPSQESAWLALAMSSTLAGNLTLVGSVANLIVVENASREGVIVSFWDYCKVGMPLTILTLLFGIAWLELVPY